MNTSKNELKIFTDGGSRGNPGPSAYGFVIYQNGKKIYSEGEYLGMQTNNYAEYMAVIKSFEWIRKNLNENYIIDLYCDSLLVASQLSGKFKVKHPSIIQLVKRAKALESHFSKVSYTHIFREKNTEADSMVNFALDKRA